MAKFVDMKAKVTGKTDKAVQLTFHEGLPEEQDLWVPLSVIEDTDATEPEKEDSDGNVNVSVAKWFLKKNDVPYDREE